MITLLVVESCVIIPDPVFVGQPYKVGTFFHLLPPCLTHPCSGLQNNSSFSSSTLDKKDLFST